MMKIFSRSPDPGGVRTTCLSGTIGLCAIVLTGEVTPGVTCPAILTDEGETVALSHIPSSYDIGDRITVTGSEYAGSASCQTLVLVVTDVVPAE